MRVVEGMVYDRRSTGFERDQGTVQKVDEVKMVRDRQVLVGGNSRHGHLQETKSGLNRHYETSIP